MNIAVQGNIASTKTTMIELVRENSIVVTNVKTEPVHEWSESLQLYYSDPKRYGFLMNCTALASLAQIYHDKPNENKLVERNADAVLYVFSKVSDMHEEEHKTLKRLHDVATRDFSTFATIYLRSDPAKCYERMLKRGRPEERNVTLEYLKDVHEKHEEWLLNEENVHVVEVEDREEGDVFRDILKILSEEDYNFRSTLVEPIKRPRAPCGRRLSFST